MAALSGSAVTDVIHLLAELIENATSLSPPYTQVKVTGESVTNGFAIEIEDRGLGMTPERQAELNDRLTNPPDVNPTNTEQLGLFVVAQLARRHGIQVTLRTSPYGGTSAVVLISSRLVVNDAPAALTSGENPMVKTGPATPPALPFFSPMGAAHGNGSANGNGHGPANGNGYAPGGSPPDLDSIPVTNAFGTGMRNPMYQTGTYQTGAYQQGTYQTGTFQTGSLQSGMYQTGGFQSGAYQTGAHPQQGGYSQQDSYGQQDSHGQQDHYGQEDWHQQQDSYSQQDSYPQRDGYTRQDQGTQWPDDVPVVTGIPVSRDVAPPFDVFTPISRPNAETSGSYAPESAKSPNQAAGYGNIDGHDSGYDGGGLSAGEHQGLPRRVRQASIAPQLRDSAATGPRPMEADEGGLRTSGASLSNMRNTLSAMQRGWQQGRSESVQRDTEGNSLWGLTVTTRRTSSTGSSMTGSCACRTSVMRSTCPLTG
jgi:hypothetical protein